MRRRHSIGSTGASLKQLWKKFGFSGQILQAIMALYSNPSAKVVNSSILSDSFRISNGTRQECPLSPLIFTLIMEPCAHYIRTNPLISGIKVGDQIHKIGLYADDVIISITNPVQSLPHLHLTLDRLSKASLCKINFSKS